MRDKDGILHIVQNNRRTSIYQIARELRKRMTPAEEILWKRLKKGALGVKVRRQEGFYFGKYRYIADFCCHSIKLIIEIDGSVHEDEEIKEIDEFREDIFIDNGYTVIRFTNNEIINNTDGLVKTIEDWIDKNK